MKNPLKALINKIKRPYYYVPNCPQCGSRMTGRFMKLPSAYEADWIINESLRNGELVCLVPEVLNHNAYCVECDHTWYADIKVLFLRPEQINIEKIERHTNEILKIRYDNLNEVKKQKKAKHGFVFNHVTNFIGKV